MIARILAGERELFHELIRPYERGLYLAAYSIVQNEADAEDIAQDAVIKAYKGLKNFRGEANFSTWLMAITLNEARSRWRKTKGEQLDFSRRLRGRQRRLHAFGARRLALHSLGGTGAQGAAAGAAGGDGASSRRSIARFSSCATCAA